jgi:hypothetical protein
MKERVMRVAIAPWSVGLSALVGFVVIGGAPTTAAGQSVNAEAPRMAKLTSVDLVEAPPCLERALEHMVDGSHHTNPR